MYKIKQLTLLTFNTLRSDIFNCNLFSFKNKNINRQTMKSFFYIHSTLLVFVDDKLNTFRICSQLISVNI